jgi:hypothetical protein
MRCNARLIGAAAVLALLCLRAPSAIAAPPWIYRSLVLPRGDIALDLGVGMGRAPIDANRSYTGFGMNLEIKGGITSELELGLRTGVRFDADGQATHADEYGRAYETETFGTREDRMANPELRLTWAVARGAVAQLGLEMRAYFPFEDNSRFGLMFAVPIALRLGAVRFDSGIYVPVLFYDPTQTAVSVPLHIWIQASSTFWLGPILGIRVVNDNPGGSHDEYPLGFGLGSMLSHAVDLRFWFLFPHINGNSAARTWGTGLALEIRFE